MQYLTYIVTKEFKELLNWRITIEKRFRLFFRLGVFCGWFLWAYEHPIYRVLLHQWVYTIKSKNNCMIINSSKWREGKTTSYVGHRSSPSVARSSSCFQQVLLVSDQGARSSHSRARSSTVSSKPLTSPNAFARSRHFHWSLVPCLKASCAVPNLLQFLIKYHIHHAYLSSYI